MSTQNFQNLSVSGSTTTTKLICDEIITNIANITTTDWNINGTLKTNSITNATGNDLDITSSNILSLGAGNVIYIETSNIQLGNTLNTYINHQGNVFFGEQTSSNINFTIYGGANTTTGCYIHRNGAVSINKNTLTAGYSLDALNGITTSAVLQTTRTENPTGNTNGALRVTGGASIQRDLILGGNVTCGNIILRNNGVFTQSGNMSVSGNLLIGENIYINSGDGLSFPNKCSITYAGVNGNGLLIDTGNLSGQVLGANILVGNIAGNSNAYINFKIQGPAFKPSVDVYPIGCVVDYAGRLLIGTETALASYTLQNAGNTRTQCLTAFSGSDIDGIGQASLEVNGGAIINKRCWVKNLIETGNLIVRGNATSPNYNGNIFSGNLNTSQDITCLGLISCSGNISSGNVSSRQYTGNVISLSNGNITMNNGNLAMTSSNIICNTMGTTQRFRDISFTFIRPSGSSDISTYLYGALATGPLANNGILQYATTIYNGSISAPSASYIDLNITANTGLKLMRLTVTFDLSGALTLTSGTLTLQSSTTSAFTTFTSRTATKIAATYGANYSIQAVLEFFIPISATPEKFIRVQYTGSASIAYNTTNNNSTFPTTSRYLLQEIF